MKVAINICEEFAEQWETQARGGDNTGASDHRADAARQIIAELRNVNAAPQQSAQSGDALTRDLLETLQMMVKHFTKTPSTLADSKARGKSHEVIAKAYEQIGYTAPTAAPEKGDGRDAWQPIDETDVITLIGVANFMDHSGFSKSAEAVRRVHAAIGLAATSSSGWSPIETAPEGKLLVVCWFDRDDPENPERHDFDYLEDGVWAKHADDYDHFCCVAPPGSHGPSADAPYTHWMALPDVPAALSQKAGEQQ